MNMQRYPVTLAEAQRLGWPTLDVAKSREVDQQAIEDYGIDGFDLMVRAAHGCAERIFRIPDVADRMIIVLCGPGNNGGDGWVIASRLLELNRTDRPITVKVLSTVEPDQLSDDASLAYQRARQADVQFSVAESPEQVREILQKWSSSSSEETDTHQAHEGKRQRQPLWVDCLLGTGSKGAPRPAMAEAINWANRDAPSNGLAKSESKTLRRVAIDVPTGLDADRGICEGIVFAADMTLTFVAPKTGFANPSAKSSLGIIEIVDIGLPSEQMEKLGIPKTNVLGMLRSEGSAGELAEQIESLCDVLQHVYDEGYYCKINVYRHWSRHNPMLSGKVARPRALRWYLRRELYKLAWRGAEIAVYRSRPRVDLSSPQLLHQLDESDFDLTRKKVFLFGPERSELSIQRLEHYTGTPAENFQRYVLLTNYQMHMDAFKERFPDCVGSPRDVQMPALHAMANDNLGITIINIGVGPSNAKNLTDHLAVLRPDAMLMVGHCAGVRNHQDIHDFVLASGYMRADGILDDLLPLSVPITPSFHLNRALASVLDESGLNYRLGAVYTTADRNWELRLKHTLEDLRVSRSIAVDMESATVAANGFRYRIPTATLLCVSDKPLHGKPKLPGDAAAFYDRSKEEHIRVAAEAIEQIKNQFPNGLPNSDLRAFGESLLDGHEIDELDEGG
ncbi:MAG: NAD(P)H-hydrate epimerase [Planctomycetota bacterium]